MKAKDDLEFWLNFVSEHEERETNDEVITFYDFKKIFEYYLENLKGELDKMTSSLKFPFEVKNINLEISIDDDESVYIKLSYDKEEDGYTIDSYNIDELGIYYTGYTLTEQQQATFYQENYDFFQRIVQVYYLNNLFYTEGFSFYKEYSDDDFGTEITFSNVRETNFTIWRKVSEDRYGDDDTLFTNKYLNRPDINELYNEVLKRNVINISTLDEHANYLMSLAKIDGILNKQEKVKKL